MKSPHISLVFVGRNDDYGGDFKGRLEVSVNENFRALTAAGIPSEMIFVNYNPLPEVPIEEFIDWPKSNETVIVRIISVSPSVHQDFVRKTGVENFPVLEYAAKNAGIRRAEGEFLLCLNPDIILPANLIKRFRGLQKGRYYRCDRLDYAGDYGANWSLTKAHLRGQSFHIDSIEDLSQLRRKNHLLNLWRRSTPRLKMILDPLSIPIYYNNIENQLHCNATGDFLLMHRDHWFELKGHRENAPISLHVDALMVVQAAASGLKEVVFDEPIFHKEHTRRFDANKRIPAFEEAYRSFLEEANIMLREQMPKTYNGSDWGLVNFDLSETKP